ncbi:unnamed protein product [Clonostachys solani]|uniref:DUF6536 domain-containing protein n=1 Tax=Clonostachys solani TaxID=160281 RepID=A0A9P0EJ42_9HYPO|nr:unnamed protein product [Clonostachys solani]
MRQSSSEERLTMYLNSRQPSPEGGVPLIEPSSIPLNIPIVQNRRPQTEFNRRGDKKGMVQVISPAPNDMSSHDSEQQLLLYNSAQISSKTDDCRYKSARNPRQQPGPGCLTGWRGGLSIAAGLTLLILIGNITILGVFSSPAYRRDYSSATAPIRTGECDEIKKLNFGIHLIINIASTLLLGASNYCMQTVSAPTRHDIDIVHASGKWLQIGVPSLRNLRFIGKKRVFVWLCLAITSIPLHLVYNSVLFMSTSYNKYRIYFANENFASWARYEENNFNITTEMALQLIGRERYQALPNNDCIEAYAKDLIQGRGNVILVIQPPKSCSVFQEYEPLEVCTAPSTTSLYASHNYKHGVKSDSQQNWYYWICSQKSYIQKDEEGKDIVCNKDAWERKMSNDIWEVAGVKVKYCLSEQTPSRCRLHIATNLVVVVIAFNLAKLLLITLILFGNWADWDPLVTIGDAIASFIKRPDPNTGGMCLLATEEIMEFWGSKCTRPQEYRLQSDRWASAVSTGRWIIAVCLIAATLSILICLLVWAISSLPRSSLGGDDFKSIWSLGVGKISPYTLISAWDVPSAGDAAVVCLVLLTNLPQALFSFLYLILNGILTSMVASREWTDYACHVPKALRVSFPRRGQRSTFFLGLPYRYSLPLIISSVLMHWLISQSFFMVQMVEVRTWESQKDQEDIKITDITTTAGYSPLAMFLAGFVLLVVSSTIARLGGLRFKQGMPLTGSCSVGIAAACHAYEKTSSRKPLAWGVVVPANRTLDGVGHCSFSNKQVDLPEPGSWYA